MADDVIHFPQKPTDISAQKCKSGDPGTITTTDGDVIFVGLSDVDDRKECAFIRLRGATERLLLVLQYRSDHNYETGMKAVEHAMAEYRGLQ
jgi:hypothetical protein